MLTLYSVVKGFDNPQIATIQRNAIQSWQAVLPDAEIVLFGDDEPGAREEARWFGVPILPIARNEHGAPLVADVIARANQVAHYDVRCLVNADILLEPSFSEAVAIVADEFDAFLLITRRYNVKLGKPLDFDGDWHAQVCALERNAYTICGSDVFCYRGNWLVDMPAFGMGRTSWDNWIVERAAIQGVPIVDGTKYTRAFHQQHEKVKPGAEKRVNRDLLRAEFGKVGVGSLNRARHKLTEAGKVVKR